MLGKVVELWIQKESRNTVKYLASLSRNMVKYLASFYHLRQWKPNPPIIYSLKETQPLSPCILSNMQWTLACLGLSTCGVLWIERLAKKLEWANNSHQSVLLGTGGRVSSLWNASTAWERLSFLGTEVIDGVVIWLKMAAIGASIWLSDSPSVDCLGGLGGMTFLEKVYHGCEGDCLKFQKPTSGSVSASIL